MDLTNKTRSRQIGLITLFFVIVLAGGVVIISYLSPRPVQAAATGFTSNRNVAAGLPLQQGRECDGEETGRCNDGTCTHAETRTLACIYGGGLAEWYGPDGPPPTVSVPPPSSDITAPGAPTATPQPPTFGNLITNGNFEFGFYAVPQLGFERRDIGNVPKGWDWYKSDTYGKYTIFNNQTLGLKCPDSARPPVDDSVPSVYGPIPGVSEEDQRSANALGLHMQSTDEQDARLGVYQVVDVVPGQTYRFAMSGTLQIQSGATTLQPDDPTAPQEAQNHTVELFFDHTGNTDWEAIPHEQWVILPWQEQKLEFKVSEDDEDISEIEDYITYVEAQSNKMTVFMTLWRKWANWRTGIASIDCVSLVPINPANIPPPSVGPKRPVVDLSGGRIKPRRAQPASAGQPGSVLQPAPGLPVTGLEESQHQAPQDGSQTGSTHQNPSLAPQNIEPVAPPSSDAAEPQGSAQPGAVPVEKEQVTDQTASNQPVEQKNAEVAQAASEVSVLLEGETIIETGESFYFVFASIAAAVGLIAVGMWQTRR